MYDFELCISSHEATGRGRKDEDKTLRIWPPLPPRSLPSLPSATTPDAAAAAWGMNIGYPSDCDGGGGIAR